MGLVVGVMLLVLSYCHGQMISRDETSVECLLHQNYKEDFIKYKNDRINNFKRFFGVDTVGEFIRRILLPSTHKPKGNGITTDGYELPTHRKRHDSYASNIYHSISENYLIKGYRSELSSWRKPRTSSSQCIKIV
jgi:hypothetical protein